MATKTQALQGALSDLLDSLYDMGIDKDTVAIAAESRKNRESLHSDVLLQRIVAAKVALAMPLRNCEVGTVEEQERRFRKYCETEECNRYRCGHGCKAVCIDRCVVVWSQMPYEDEKDGAE